MTLAEQAVAAASGTDIIVDHANATLALARVCDAAGDHASAQVARAEARRLFQQKGATVEVDNAHGPIPDRDDPTPVDPDTAAGSALDNAATDAVVTLLDLLQTGDVAAARSRLASDFARLDRSRSLAAEPMDGDTWLESMGGFSGPGGREITFVAVAVRDDDLALVEGRSEAENGFVTPFLATARQNDQGLIDRIEIFDPDDLRAAVAELDRLYLEQLDPRLARTYREYLRADELMSAGDLDGVLAVAEPDAVIVDHRNLGFGPDSTIEERYRSLFDSTTSRFLFYTKIHRLDFGSIAGSRRYLVETLDGRQLTQDVLGYFEVDPALARLSRVEQFDQDDIEQALAVYQDRSTSPARRLAPVNLATWAGAYVERLASRGLVDLAADRVAEGCIVERADGSTQVVSPSEIRSGSMAMADLGFGGGSRRLLVVMGEQLALVGKQLADGTSCVAIEEIDDDDRLCRITFFDVDRLSDAANQIEARWLELLHGGSTPVPSAVGVVNEYALAYREYDIDRLRELTSPDHRTVDHRPMGFPTMDRDELMAATAHVASATNIRLTTKVPAYADHGLVIVFHIVDTAGGRGWTEALPAVIVFHIVDERVAAMELFAGDDLDAALARFDELAGEPEPSSVENAASRLGQQLASHLNRGQPVDALLADDFLWEDRRAVVTMPLPDRDEYIAQIGQILYEVDATAWNNEPIAVRTDRHCLAELSIEFGNGGSVIELLSLWSIDDADLIIRQVLFDTDDLPAAVAELDRLYIEELDPPLAAAFREHARFMVLAAARDVEGAIDGFHPEAIIVDHRELGWGPESTIRDRVTGLPAGLPRARSF